MIVPLPIFITDPAEARAARVALLGELRTAAEDATQRVRAAATRASDVTNDVDEIDALADAIDGLMGRYCEAGVDRGTLLEHARIADGRRDDVWLANALVDLRHRYQRLAIDAQDLIDTAEIYATPPPPPPPPQKQPVDPLPVAAGAFAPLRVL